jgi:hypothetical protein
LLARLIYPVANPHIDYEFRKGFYARVTDRMSGRGPRLLVTPLIRSLQEIVGHSEFLRFLDSFRYQLAGEFCMQTDLARAEIEHLREATKETDPFIVENGGSTDVTPGAVRRAAIDDYSTRRSNIHCAPSP